VCVGAGDFNDDNDLALFIAVSIATLMCT